ncbi:MBL fold metallo-hydrolase [Herbaspirillum sp. YR522]|uniref:MBL fold metallo-hydrolase n=1 Tax=Herbaspirillum sp. YR522 TaxID=1144342 RepID=UPI00026F4B11|nr:MBL fold metallo-hydrolase [Herbaspirillum sp. YR522]EJM99561.1 Zn-dependent hydrolase, glyoxylase [Herbaspirillum sp. YR522]
MSSPAASPLPIIQSLFDDETSTITYIVFEREGGPCAIIDPVLDYDPRSGRTATRSADKVIDVVRTRRLSVQWLLETHAHADHLSAAAYLKQHLGGAIAIGDAIRSVQRVFKGIYNLEQGFAPDGSQFDYLFHADEAFRIGGLHMRALHVPGHTAADMAYMLEDQDGAPQLVFVGDTLFMPDLGSARCDFPGGNAHALYRSARRLLSLPPTTRLFMCHDYPPQGRSAKWETTVAEQRAANIHLHDGVEEGEFVAMRQERDATLGMPLLILPAIQVNIRAGKLPAPEANGVRYLKIPVDAL